MQHVLFAQVARPRDWFLLLIAGVILLFALSLLLEALGLPHPFPSKSKRGGSRTGKLCYAIILGAMGWFFIAKELGLPFAGPGPVLVRDLVTQIAVLGLIMLTWFGVTLTLRGLRSSENAEAIDNVDDYLEPAETILWRGRPDYRLFRSETWAAFVFGCILILPGSAAVGLTVFGILQEGPELTFAIPMFAGLGFLSIAGYLLTSPWRMRRVAQIAEYAITDCRVLLVRPPGWCRNWLFPTLKQSFYEYGREHVCIRRHERRSRKRTDIIFETEVHVGSKRTHNVDIGLIGLPDWEEVERILELHFPKLSPGRIEETPVGVEPT